MPNTVKIWTNSMIMEYEINRANMTPKDEMFQIQKILDESDGLSKTEINRLKYRLDRLKNPDKIRRSRCRRRFFNPSKVSGHTIGIIKDLIKMERFDEGYYFED